MNNNNKKTKLIQKCRFYLTKAEKITINLTLIIIKWRYKIGIKALTLKIQKLVVMNHIKNP